MVQPSIRQPAKTLSGAILADRYQMLKEIGSGSMGSVYEARHTVLGRRLAVKVLKADCSSDRLKQRFFNEAKAAGAINHQHIVQVYDFGLVPESAEPYIVMEYVDGESLQDYMDRKGALDPADAVEIIAQVLSTLDVIHHAGLVHRDIKPSNIMLVKARRPRLFTKLLDFGIAKAVNEEWDWPTLTRVDEVLGTPVYLSPEQAMGGKADRRWDLWATAIMMYEMLAGKLPFPTTSLIQITEDIVNFNLTPLDVSCPHLPVWLLEIQSRALHSRLELRFQDAAEFLHAVEEKSADAPPEGQKPARVMQDTEPSPPLMPGTVVDQPALEPPPEGAESYSLLDDLELPGDDEKTIPMVLPPQFAGQQAPGVPVAPDTPPVPAPAPTAGPIAQQSTALVSPLAMEASQVGALPQAPLTPQELQATSRPRWPIFVALAGVFLVASAMLGVIYFLFGRS